MSVSGIGSSSSSANIYELLFRKTQATQGAGSCQPSGGAEGVSGSAPQSVDSNTSTGDAGQLFTDLRKQIEDSIEELLEKWLTGSTDKDSDSTEGSSEDSTTANGTDAASGAADKGPKNGHDLLSKIKEAVGEVLEKNGIDPGSFRGPPPGPPPSGPRPEGISGGNSAGNALSESGIDLREFQQNLLEALQGAKTSGNQVDYSKIFQDFPAGSSVDLLA